jgi:hypothetical protein
LPGKPAAIMGKDHKEDNRQNQLQALLGPPFFARSLSE